MQEEFDSLRAIAEPHELGNLALAAEDARSTWGWGFIEILAQDVKYALRQLRQRPGFTAVVVLSLALGIGANTAIFSVVDVLMLRRLPVRSPEELVAVKIDDGTVKADFWYYVNHSYPDYLKLRERTDVFSDVSAISLLDRTGVTVDGAAMPDSTPVRVALTSGNYFRMLGIEAAIGRTFRVDDDRTAGAHPVAVISDAYWRRRFSGSRDVAGRKLALNGTTFIILGVMPSGFSGDWVGRPTDIWIPIMMQSQVMIEMPGLLTRGNGWLRLVARLKPGVTLEQAEAVIEVVGLRIAREHAGPDATPQQLRLAESDRMSLVSAARGYSSQRATYGPALPILMSVVGLVLLIACVNVANLLLARSTARQREIAVRLAIGAGRGRILRQLFTEGVLLAVLGGALAVLLSMWCTKALSAVSLAPVQMDSRAASSWVSYDLHPDLRILGFAAVLSGLTAIVFALGPAFRSSRISLTPALTGRGTQSPRHGVVDLTRLLVIAEVAVSVVLLIGAGLFLRTLWSLRSVNLGLDRQHVLLVWTAPGQAGRSGNAIISTCRRILQGLSELPGVMSVGASSGGLLLGSVGGVPSEFIKIPGQPPKPGQIEASTAVVPGYFAALGLPLVAGRDFTEFDTATSPRVSIVNETFAKFFFGDQNPIGQHYGALPNDTAFSIEIIGVVKDTKYGSPRDKNRMWTYSPYLQGIGLLRNMQVAVRVAGNPVNMVGIVRREIERLDPALPVLRIDTVEEQVDDVIAPERLTATLTSSFGALATLMACLGLYGVISYTIGRRTNEIGIRMALGATRPDVFRMVFAESASLVFAGLVVGLSLSLATSRVLMSWLFGVRATDPVTFAAATLLTILVSVLAVWIPARRASSVDPMIALRCE